MYLLFVDESGTHGGSHSFILGGIAVHEQDARPLGRRLDGVVAAVLEGQGITVGDYELHGAEIRNAKSPASRTGRPSSPWAVIPRARRLDALASAYRLLAEFRSADPDFPVVLFGVVMDRRFRSGVPVIERERFAYQVLFTKFDALLKRAPQCRFDPWTRHS